MKKSSHRPFGIPIILLICLITVVPFVPMAPAQPVKAAGPAISNVSNNSASYPNGQVPLYGKFELTFDVSTVATNLQFPYDPAPPPGVTPGVGISVDGLFSSDNWATTLAQPGFLYQQFLRENKAPSGNGFEWLYPQGDPVWKIRFSALKKGTWRYKIRVTDASGTSYYPSTGDLTFSVAPSTSKGFIRVSPTDSRYFEFSDRTPFIGVGTDEGFDPVGFGYDADARMPLWNANKVNFFRIWMSGSSIVGSGWLPWNFPGAASPSLSADYSFTDRFSTKLDNNRSMTQERVPVKPSTTYKIQVRAKTVGVTGPANPANANYGLVVKAFDCANCGPINNQLPLTPYLKGDNDWTVLTGELRTNGTQYQIGWFNLNMENTTGGAIYIDEISLREDLGGGRLGPEILRKNEPNYELYFDQAKSFAWDHILDSAAQYGVYLKLVVMEKSDWVYNHIDWNGNTVAQEAPNNANFYGNQANPNTAVRRYQEYYWRYLAARWGYSTAVHSWELLNEGDPFNGNHYSQANAFARFMHQNEPSRHLVTTSTWHSYPAKDFWGNPAYPDIDYGDLHTYISSTGTGLYEWSPPAGTTLEVNPAYVMGRNGGSIKVPAGKSSVNGDTGLAVQGKGTWNVSVWMKVEGYNGSCPYGAPPNLAGPQLKINVDGISGGSVTRAIPYNPNEPNKYFICTNDFTGTRDWSKFSGTIDVPDDNYHNFRVGFDTSFAITG
ncbi:MAG: DUF5060 domain-containing protein, partial [Candidatus Marsarchaeota archaeon]|nr:DUF5060 domain-containing protein [Candidatus Marsarchaeota archaeon]